MKKRSWTWVALVLVTGCVPLLCRLMGSEFTDDQSVLWGAVFLGSLILGETIRDVR